MSILKMSLAMALVAVALARSTQTRRGMGMSMSMGKGKSPRPGWMGRRVLNLKGTATGHPMIIDSGDGRGPIDNMCFTTDLFDAATDTQIGQGTDCLEIVGVLGGADVVGHAFFEFYDGSVLATKALTSVREANSYLAPFSHVTGAKASGTGDSVTYPAIGTGPATGRTYQATDHFDNVMVSARLSGMVNMAAGVGMVAFDCLFVIDLSPL
jgi:hypothetical protein